MPSLFDSERFNTSLFFPCPNDHPCQSGNLDLWVEVSGARLQVRWRPSRPGFPTLLVFPGNGETPADYEHLADAWAEFGIGLAVFGYRGYGQSTGTPSLRGTLEDGRAATEALIRAGGSPVVLLGRSLGSACLAHIHAMPTPGVVGSIWESGFTDLRGLIRRRGIEPPETLDEADRAAFDPLPKLGSSNLPFLALHGAEDEVIPPEESRMAYRAAGSCHKRFFLVPGRGHNDLVQDRTYFEIIRGFLSEL